MSFTLLETSMYASVTLQVSTADTLFNMLQKYMNMPLVLTYWLGVLSRECSPSLGMLSVSYFVCLTLIYKGVSICF